MLKNKVKTCKPTRTSSRGFGTSKVDQTSLIMDVVTSTADLRGSNIDHTVAANRRVWDRDYPFRTTETYTEEKLFTPSTAGEVQVIDHSQIIRGNTGVPLPAQITQILNCGYWQLMIHKFSKMNYSFDFHVNAGDRWVFHPLEGRNQILSHHSQEMFEKWKRTVRADWQISAPKLIEEYRKHPAANVIWSVCASHSSERLMKAVGLPVHKGIAFLIA